MIEIYLQPNKKRQADIADGLPSVGGDGYGVWQLPLGFKVLGALAPIFADRQKCSQQGAQHRPKGGV